MEVTVNLQACNFARAICFFLLLAGASFTGAQIPTLAAVPVELPEAIQQRLTQERAALWQRRSDVVSRVGQHNQSCSSVPAGSPQAQACSSQQSELQGLIRSYAADVGRFNDEVANAVNARKDTPVNEEAASRLQQLRGRIAELRVQIVGIQNALLQLNKSITGEQKERSFWEKTISEGSERATERAIHLTAGELLDAYGAQLNQQIGSANSEIAQAERDLPGETNPNRREQIQAALQWLRRDKATLEAQKVLLADGGKKFNEQVELLRDLAEPQADRERLLTLAYSGLQGTLDSPAFRDVLHVGEKYAVGAKWAKAAVDSTYDAVSVGLGWWATYRLNENVEGYRTAVPKLEKRMQDVVKELQDTEAQLETVRREMTPQ
jgi:predicted  nucleic acid-binding Zn-ribbon protein